MPALAETESATGFDEAAFESLLSARNEPDWLADRRRQAFAIYQDKLAEPLDPEEFKRVEQYVGLPLDQLLAVPKGEVCVALVPTADEKIRPALILDAKDNVHLARKALVALEEVFASRGWTKAASCRAT